MNLTVKEWQTRIEEESKLRKTFRDRVNHIESVYSGNQSPSTQGADSSDYNILWINTEIMQSALYATNPKPDVRRRYKDFPILSPSDLTSAPPEIAQQLLEENKQMGKRYNEVGKNVALVTERALTYTMDTQDFFGNASSAVLSFVKFSAGTMRARYCPVIAEGMAKKITVIKNGDKYEREDGLEFDFDSVQIDEEGGFFVEDVEEFKEYEEIKPEFVPIQRFHWECVSAWEDVSWCVIDHYLTKEELIEQFGEKKAALIPLNYSEAGNKAKGSRNAKSATRALIRECFDKRKLKVQIYAEGLDELLEDMEDPYNLQDFYPFPKPMLGTMGDDGINPVPDYIYYQDQHAELNTITSRISKLLEVVKYRGVYDGSLAAMNNITALNDGEFQSASNYAELAATMGGSLDLNKLIAEMPIANAQNLLNSMYQYREQVIKVIFEITGISDIVRGSSKASETLGAQQLKSQYANLRLQTKQQIVERFFRDYFRIMSEFICEKFDTDNLKEMTGIDITPDMEEIMTSDLSRSYIIDVETDSTVMQDAAEDQKNRIEALTAMTNMFAQLAPLLQMGVPMDLVGQMLLFGLKGFKGGRELEDMIEGLLEAQANQEPAQPSEEEMLAKEQAKLDLEHQAILNNKEATETAVTAQQNGMI